MIKNKNDFVLTMTSCERSGDGKVDMEELEEKDLDALGDLIDEMFVAKAHPREIMKLLMEHENQWNQILLRVLRFARIYQLDFICKCTDSQIRVIAKHTKTNTLVTDLCVWQVLQSGLPSYIKNMFRRDAAPVATRHHPWHGGRSNQLDDFETYMSSCPQKYQLSPSNLTKDFLGTTLWLSRIFQDDVFFSQDAECCKAMLEVPCPAEILIPFMGQLMERGKPQLKALVWNRWKDCQVSLWSRSAGDAASIFTQVANAEKYRRLFYGCHLLDMAIGSKALHGFESIACRIKYDPLAIAKPHSDSNSRQVIDELVECTGYAEFEMKRTLMGVHITKHLIARLMGENPRYKILAGLIENHLTEIEKKVPLEILIFALIRWVKQNSELEVLLRAVEHVRPGSIKNFHDAYGGNALHYLPRPTLHYPQHGITGRYELLTSLGCDPEELSPNGCSIAELQRYVHAKDAGNFDFEQAVKL